METGTLQWFIDKINWSALELVKFAQIFKFILYREAIVVNDMSILRKALGNFTTFRVMVTECIFMIAFNKGNSFTK